MASVRSVVVAAAVAATVAACLTSRPLGAQPSVALVTAGPGADAASWAGHAMLVVEEGGHGTTYEFGEFRRGPALARGLRTGVVIATLATHDAAERVAELRAEHRSVRVQTLALTPIARTTLARRLARLAADPTQRTYRYDYRTDNCTTRLRDQIDAASDGVLWRAGHTPARRTLRARARGYLADRPGFALLLDALVNDEGDQPATRWDEAAFPAALADLVADASLATVDTHDGPIDALGAGPAEGPLVAVGAALALLPMAIAAFLRGRARRALLGAHAALAGVALGVPGLVATLAWATTAYAFAPRNENLLFMNPIALLAVPFGVAYAVASERRAARWERRLAALWTTIALAALVALALKALPTFDQDNARILALALPLAAGLAAALRPAPLHSFAGDRSRWPTEAAA